MKPITWEEKLATLQEINGGRRMLIMVEPGKWICSIPGEVGGDGLLSGWCGRGNTPESAINSAWEQWVSLPKDRHVYLSGRGRFRWSPRIGLVPLRDVEQVE